MAVEAPPSLRGILVSRFRDLKPPVGEVAPSRELSSFSQFREAELAILNTQRGLRRAELNYLTGQGSTANILKRVFSAALQDIREFGQETGWDFRTNGFGNYPKPESIDISTSLPSVAFGISFGVEKNRLPASPNGIIIAAEAVRKDESIVGTSINGGETILDTDLSTEDLITQRIHLQIAAGIQRLIDPSWAPKPLPEEPRELTEEDKMLKAKRRNPFVRTYDKFDGSLQMMPVKIEGYDMHLLTFMRWLAERGRLEHQVAGIPSGQLIIPHET